MLKSFYTVVDNILLLYFHSRELKHWSFCFLCFLFAYRIICLACKNNEMYCHLQHNAHLNYPVSFILLLVDILHATYSLSITYKKCLV